MALVGALGAGALGAWLLAWPVPLEPEAWDPPAFHDGDWVPTGSLASANRVPLPDGHGPEDVELDAAGNVLVGLHDGRILRFPAGGGASELLADTGGRPLGLHPDGRGGLLVADAGKGLLRVSPEGKVEVLTSGCGGRALVFTDDLETTADGTVWFTDASVRFHQPDWKLDLLENTAAGRLCAYDPATGETREVLAGLYFANGVAVDPDQQFVLVNETSRYRVQKVWIDGPRAGEHEILIDNLPGFPDGISTGEGGRFWIALASPRNPAVDGAGPFPWLRKVMVRLPVWAQPAPKLTARAMAIDAEGRVLHDLFDPVGERLHVVTSVQERDGRLYLGSLVDTAWAWVDAP